MKKRDSQTELKANGSVVSAKTKASEERLRETERKYEQLVRYAPAAIYEIDFRRRRFTSVNDAMCVLSGYTRQELLAMDPLEILDEAGKARFENRLRKWFSGEQPSENVEYRVRAKDGRVHDVVLNATYTSDESGKPLGATVVAHDVTERRRMEQELRRSREQYRDLVEGCGCKAVREELALAPVDLGALLRGMLDPYPEFQRNRAHIELDGEFPPVMANEAGLTQCFSNLLGNAVKFVAPGATPEVRVRSEARDGWVRIWVEDKGIGIPRTMLPRLFHMFSRGQHDYDGTGIGLALVRKVVERMRGRVGVESELGKGRGFWVDLRPGDVRHPQPRATSI